jgi:hypothetical protein
MRRHGIETQQLFDAVPNQWLKNATGDDARRSRFCRDLP